MPADHPGPLSADAIEERLEENVETVLSSRRTAAGPAAELALVDKQTQNLVLDAVAVIASTNAELAFQFASHATKATAVLDSKQLHAWMIRAMDIFDTTGLHAAVSFLQDVDGFARELQVRTKSLELDSIQTILENYLHGLSGRPLRIGCAEQHYTDTETVFLPALCKRFESERDNFRLYKSMAVMCWAQTWYGTWQHTMIQALRDLSDSPQVLPWYHFFESRRLELLLQSELPGVFRDLLTLQKMTGYTRPHPENWSVLGKPSAGPECSLAMAEQHRHKPFPPDWSSCYDGGVELIQIQGIVANRLGKEKDQLKTLLAQWQDELNASAPNPNEQPPAQRRAFHINEQVPQDTTISLDGKPVTPPTDVKNLLTSIYQDLGQIPDEYLVPAGDGQYNENAPARDPRDVWKGTYHEEGAFLYHEWDFERQHYRKNWAVLRELDVHPQWDHFVDKTRTKYAGLIKQCRRTFEALRGEDKVLKRQPVGDDIDIDAVVQAQADLLSGMEMSDCLFTKMHKVDRNIAVMFMVDMSGSTKGWINDAEREALVLLCEALQSLGDRYAIYGFSSLTHKRCEIFRVKRFDEDYSEQVKARISGIKPQDYTRMGVAIRHLCTLLQQVEARTKILITLSDGKPDDWDSYRGQYGIEDTRQALIEAKRANIHPYCITIDTQAKSYLPHMYGAVNFTVIDQVHKLPLRISDIYRRLTA